MMIVLPNEAPCSEQKGEVDKCLEIHIRPESHLRKGLKSMTTENPSSETVFSDTGTAMALCRFLNTRIHTRVMSITT